jgi:hypothetical protein
MGQLLHDCARTTASVRHAIQQSQESVSKLAARYGINPKTVVKWKKRTHLTDAPVGTKEKRSTVSEKLISGVTPAGHVPKWWSHLKIWTTQYDLRGANIPFFGSVQSTLTLWPSHIHEPSIVIPMTPAPSVQPIWNCPESIGPRRLGSRRASPA